MELLFKKVYTVAFRLTGKEEIAERISISAITKTYKELNEEFKATENIFQVIVLELVKVFLNKPMTYGDDNLKGIQKSLLKLKPINRVIIIWKDVLGYKLLDNMPIANYSYEEMRKALNIGRKELYDYYKLENSVEMQKDAD